MKWHTDKLNEWEKDALISLLLHVVSDEQRLGCARALPQVYNKLCGCEVMSIEQRRMDPGGDRGSATTKTESKKEGGHVQAKAEQGE